MMDDEERMQLEEQLRLEKRLLHHDTMARARSGINTDPAIIIRIEDREKVIAGLEARLGIAQPPVYQEPARRAYGAPRPTYRPEPDLERQRGANTEHHVKMLGIHRRNLGHLKGQARQLGAFAPPYVHTAIEEAQAGIAREKRTLRGMGVRVEDFEGE